MSNFVVKRFKSLPVTLYRLQGKVPVRLRVYAEQMEKGRTSYDLKTGEDGLVHINLHLDLEALLRILLVLNHREWINDESGVAISSSRAKAIT